MPSRPRKPNWGSPTTRPEAGTAGTATSRWSCSPSPCSWRSATRQIPSRHPKKADRPISETHGAMVTPGDPSYCLASDPASHRSGFCHRLVGLASMPSGHGLEIPPETEAATVMLRLEGSTGSLGGHATDEDHIHRNSQDRG